jgi:hypothetical protein
MRGSTTFVFLSKKPKGGFAMTQEDHVESQLLLAEMQGLTSDITEFNAQLEIIADILESPCDICCEYFNIHEVGHATTFDGKWVHSYCYDKLFEEV